MPQITMPRITWLLLSTAVSFNAASAAAPESLIKYELRVDGFGPVRVGMSPSEASKKLGIPLNLGRPPDENDRSCHYVFPEGKFEDIGFMVQNGRITRIDIYSNKINASHKIRIGSNESQVKKAYLGKIRESIHPYIGKDGKYLTVEVKPGYAFVFETDRGRITTLRAGTREAVQYIEGCQ